MSSYTPSCPDCRLHEQEIERLRAELKAVQDEREWITRKLRLPVDASISQIQGELHVACGGNDSLNTLAPMWDRERKEFKQQIERLTAALDRNRREFLSMKQSLQRGIQPHELSDQITRCKFDTEQALCAIREAEQGKQS